MFGVKSLLSFVCEANRAVNEAELGTSTLAITICHIRFCNTNLTGGLPE